MRANAETIKETQAVETTLNKAVILSADLHEGYVKKLETLGADGGVLR
jgi:DNA-binding NarL/FixJ family response regulator